MPYENLIKSKRRELGITQEELSSRTGIRSDYLSRIENSKIKNPNVWDAMNIAAALDCSVEELFSSENKEEVNDSEKEA